MLEHKAGEYNFLSAFVTKRGNNYAILTNVEASLYTPIVMQDHQKNVLATYVNGGGITSCGLCATLFNLLLVCGTRLESLTLRVQEYEDPPIPECVMTIVDDSSPSPLSCKVAMPLSDGVVIAVLSGLPIILDNTITKMVLPINSSMVNGSGVLGQILKEIELCEDYLHANQEADGSQGLETL